MLDSAEWVGVPAIVIGELCAGFRQGSRFESNTAELDAFFSFTRWSKLYPPKLAKQTSSAK